MRSSIIRGPLSAAILGFCFVASGDAAPPDGTTPGAPPAPTYTASWSGSVRIENLYAFEAYNIMRINVNTTALHNPAACTGAGDYIDIQLDVAGRSSEEQRQILNAVNMAFMTNRRVQFFVRHDICSTAASTSTVRVAVGVRVLN